MHSRVCILQTASGKSKYQKAKRRSSGIGAFLKERDIMELEEIRRRMHSGGLYVAGDPVLLQEQIPAQDLLFEYNHCPPSQWARRGELLHEMLAECGDDSYIEPPFHSNWGGRHVHLGKCVYANVFLSLVDDTHIYIGDHCMIGPQVTICTATHPICPELRQMQYEYNLPVHIGNNVWIGGRAFIMPGVTIGDNSVIGAGSVVTKDIPANVIAVGTPARVLRPITEEDRKYYNGNVPVDIPIP